MISDRSDVVVRQDERVGRGVGLDAKLHPTLRLSVLQRHTRGAQPEAHRGVRDVPLPSAPGEAPPALEQEGVPDGDLVGRHEVERRHVERAHREPVAPVRHFEEEGAVGPPGVHRDKEGRVAAEAHHPVRVPFGAVEVDDARVGGMVGVHRVVRDCVDPLVGSGRSERPALRERLASHDFEPVQCHLPPPSPVAARGFGLARLEPRHMVGPKEGERRRAGPLPRLPRPGKPQKMGSEKIFSGGLESERTTRGFTLTPFFRVPLATFARFLSQAVAGRRCRRRTARDRDRARG